MRWTPDQLSALMAVVDHGTFDAAAHALQITPSAVSQRIRALETGLGQVVVDRTTPCSPTSAGRIMIRLARQIHHLDEEASIELTGRSSGTRSLPIAVNADSLAIWFLPVLAEIATWDNVAVQVSLEDQDHSVHLLRGGEVLAAVTSEPHPIAGCRIHPLGALRYVPAATPALAAKFATDQGSGFDWADAPMVNFNLKDALQFDQLRRHGVDHPRVVHQVPSSQDFLAAVEAGLGWGMIPEPQLEPRRLAGELAVVIDEPVDVPLFWQHWRLQTPILNRLTDLVIDQGAAALRR